MYTAVVVSIVLENSFGMESTDMGLFFTQLLFRYGLIKSILGSVNGVELAHNAAEERWL